MGWVYVETGGELPIRVGRGWGDPCHHTPVLMKLQSQLYEVVPLHYNFDKNYL